MSSIRFEKSTSDKSGIYNDIYSLSLMISTSQTTSLLFYTKYTDLGSNIILTLTALSLKWILFSSNDGIRMALGKVDPPSHKYSLRRIIEDMNRNNKDVVETMLEILPLYGNPESTALGGGGGGGGILPCSLGWGVLLGSRKSYPLLD